MRTEVVIASPLVRQTWPLVFVLLGVACDRQLPEKARPATAGRTPQSSSLTRFELPLAAADQKRPLGSASAGPCQGWVLLGPELRLERFSAPLLAPGPAGSWDSADVMNPSLVERATEPSLQPPQSPSSSLQMLMLYSGFDGRAWRTGLALSRDGQHWEKSPQPVLQPSRSAGWDSQYIAANGSALLWGKKLYYWYQGGNPSRIGLAVSEAKTSAVRWPAAGQRTSAGLANCLHRTKHPGPVLEPGAPGSWESKAVADPYVLRCGDILFLYYLGQDAQDRQRLGLASSRDGLHWVKYVRNPVLEPGPPGSFDERGVGEPAVLPVSEGLAMFYTGRDAREFRRLGLAFSSDGVTWEKSGVALDVARNGWDSRVVADPHALVRGTRLWLWYGGGDVASPDQNLHGHIGLAMAPVELGLRLDYARASIRPAETRPDTPNGRWAFPYKDESPAGPAAKPALVSAPALVTLPRGSLTWVIEVPPRARFRATVRMPLPGADPARAVVRAGGQELLTRPAERGGEINVDLKHFAGKTIELELAAVPGPHGEHAAWVEWRNPRIVIQQ